MSDNQNPILGAIENINMAFEEFKKTNDERLEEETKGNQARARELQEKLDRIESEITENQKKKREFERQQDSLKERLEIVESMNDAPKGTIQDKIKSEHKDAFLSWLRAGGRDSESEAKMRDLRHKAAEFKDIVIGTDASGGYALPEEISSQIDKLMLRQSDILNEVENLTVGSSDFKKLISIHGGTSGWVGETGTRSATGTANLREVTPTWGELYAYPQVSEHALQDIFFNVEAWLTEDVADGMRQNLESALWDGNGTSKPTGFTNTAPVATADTASPIRAAAAYEYVPLDSPSSPLALDFDDIISLVYKLNRAYRPNSRFAMNQVTQGAVRKLKSTNGDYYWQPSQQAGQPDRLLGYPVFTWEDMDDYTVDNGLPIAFGDFRRGYTLCTRTGLAITSEGVTNPGYVRFYIRRRYGGIVTNNDAIKFLKIAES